MNTPRSSRRFRFARHLRGAACAVVAWFVCAEPAEAADRVKRLVMIAGKQSHGPLDHEFNAGCLLLKKKLADVRNLDVTVHLSGWPQDDSSLDTADAIFIYADGGGGHPAIQGDRLRRLEALMKKGVGLGCAHYAVEVPKEKGGPELLDWIGGYFEMHWSVNPHWVADFKSLPNHPVTRGVRPFSINDEWYFHMRFRPDMKGVTPILSGIAPAATMERPDGPHSGNPAVRESVKRGDPQHLMWLYERPDGGRGFGFTGGHRHLNWGQDDFRKVILNSLLWISKLDVPAGGVKSKVTEAELMENLDPKEGKRPAPVSAPKPK